MPRTISYNILAKARACKDQIALFRETFGDGDVIVTVAKVRRVASLFDWNWAAKNLLSLTAWADYRRIQVPAWDDYRRIQASAWADYLRAKAPALADYRRVKDSALADYERAKASAWARLYLKEA